MLELHNVSRRFGGLQALADVTMTVPEGQITGLIGPNGAGKTTLINCISGLDHPTSGTITFAGRAIHRAAPHTVTRLGVARTYQNIRLFADMSPLENLLVGQHGRHHASYLEALLFLPRHLRQERAMRERAEALLQRFGLTVPDGKGKRGADARQRAGNLPYGDQRRLELARALATHPRLLLLDEPTAGMNPVETQALGEQILRLKADGLTVLVIEHDMDLIKQVCDQVYVLNFGRIITSGSVDDVRRNPEVIEAYLGREDAPATGTLTGEAVAP